MFQTEVLITAFNNHKSLSSKTDT